MRVVQIDIGPLKMQGTGRQNDDEPTEKRRRDIRKWEWSGRRRCYRPCPKREDSELPELDFHRLDLSRSDAEVEAEVEEYEGREAFENRRFYRSGIGDLARRPPALMRFCKRSLSRCSRSLGL